MSSPAETARAKPGGRGIAGSLFRALASLQLAVVLIVVLAAVLAWATFMEAAKGREYTQWYVYSSSWFVVLLALLGTNILACTLIRFPWKRGQVGFVITHTGLLALLGGSILTFVGGMEGQSAFEEGQTADTILKTDRSQITALWQGPKDRFSTEFAFDGGPVDWRPGRILDFGEADGIAVKVMQFYRHARRHVSWVEDDARCDGPAIRFTLREALGMPAQEKYISPLELSKAAIAKLGPTLGAYPSPNAIDLEIAYNRWTPFRFAWVLMLIALVSLLLSMGTRWKTFYAAGLAAFSAGLAVMLVGFGMRIGISGRAPVTNMYESVIYLGLGVAVFGLFFEFLYVGIAVLMSVSTRRPGVPSVCEEPIASLARAKVARAEKIAS